MNPPFLLILTGPPGAGKTTLAPLVAGHFSPSVVIEGDALWANVVRGFIDPWEPAAHEQNRVLVGASIAAATTLVRGGYATILSGHLGPWFLDELRGDLAVVGAPVMYVVVRPTLDVCLARCVQRQSDPRHAGALSDVAVIRHLYEEYSDLDAYDAHVVDTSKLDADDAASIILRVMSSGDVRLS
ncbi:MAG: AAA family ATPase [Acidimicrobiales bacterium]